MAQCHLGLSSLQTRVGRSRLLLAACRLHAGEYACGMQRDPRPPRAAKGPGKKKVLCVQKLTSWAHAAWEGSNSALHRWGAPTVTKRRSGAWPRRGCHSIGAPMLRVRLAGARQALTALGLAPAAQMWLLPPTTCHPLPPQTRPGGTGVRSRAQDRSGGAYARPHGPAQWQALRPLLIAGCPSRRTGLTMMASTANCWPCQSGSPLQTTSMRRASWRGICKLISAKRTFCATRAPASRHTRASARSSGIALDGRTPAVAHAARWSPKASKAPPHRHACGVSGRGSRNLCSSSTRNCALEMVTSSWVGNTVKARAACGPACESSSAWNARDRFPAFANHA